MAHVEWTTGSVIDLGSAELSGSVSGTLARIGDEVAADAQRFAPVDTGLLRSGIHAEPPEKTASGWSVRVVADASYAFWVERGTSRMRARPYLRPALWKRRDL